MASQSKTKEQVVCLLFFDVQGNGTFS